MGFLYRISRSPYWLYSVGTGKKRQRGSTGIRHNNAKEQPKTGAAFEILQKIEESFARNKFAHFGVQQQPTSIRLANYKDDFIKWFSAHYKDSKFSTREAESAMQILLDWVTAADFEYLHELTYPVLDKFITERLDTGISANTLRRNCTTYISAWNRAKDLGYVVFDENPWRKLKPKPADAKRHSRAFTTAEQKILAAEIPKLSKSMHYIATVAQETGARLTSIVLLERGHVNLKEKLIVFPARITKTKGNTSLVTPALEKLLKGIEAENNNPYWLPKDEVQEHLARAMFKGNFSSWFRSLKKRHPEHFQGASFHCFRDSFITRGAEAGIDQRIMMQLAGHNNRAVHMKYTQMDVKKALPKLTNGTKPKPRKKTKKRAKRIRHKS